MVFVLFKFLDKGKEFFLKGFFGQASSDEKDALLIIYSFAVFTGTVTFKLLTVK